MNKPLRRALLRGIPRRYHKPILAYVEDGTPTESHFLDNVLAGDLYGALRVADYNDRRALLEIAFAIKNYAPTESYGTWERVTERPFLPHDTSQ